MIKELDTIFSFVDVVIETLMECQIFVGFRSFEVEIRISSFCIENINPK